MNWIPKTGWHNGYIEKDIDPALIVQYQECQPRVNGTDPKVVSEYEEDMREYDASLKDAGILGWQKFPRISCVKTDDGKHILVSGFHRLHAILQIGYEKIEVYCIDGTLQDAILLSKGENSDNGIRRTNADKEYVVRSCLLDEELRKWSNEQIAEWCGVAPNTVKNHEERLCNFQREKGEEYHRPAVRLYMKGDGTVGEKDTTKIGNRNEKAGQSEAGIANEKTTSEVLLQQERDQAQEAEVAMWKSFEKSPLSKYLDKEDLMEEVARVLHFPPVFPDPQEMQSPRKWITRFNIIQMAIEDEDDWVKALLEEFAEDDDLESDDLRVLWEQVTAEMKEWKKRNSADKIGRASKSMLIESLRASMFSDPDAEGSATETELQQLLTLLRKNTRSFIFRVQETLENNQKDTEKMTDAAEADEFQYAVLSGITLWYQSRQPVPNGEPIEESTYIEFGDAIGTDDGGTQERPLEDVPKLTRRILQRLLESTVLAQTDD